MPSSQSPNRSTRALLLTALWVCLIPWFGCSGEPVALAEPAGMADGRLIAVGDTGEPWGVFPELFEGQLAVGHAMQREHAARPVDAVVLLGDNFYPDGLLEAEFFPRVIQNLVRPYCGFIRPRAELASAYRKACSSPSSFDSVPKLFAAVGNHDLRGPESVRLQRDEIPRLVENWEMPLGEGPQVRELRGGISLIFILSELPWDEAAAVALSEALREARGIWRVVVGHRPPIAGHPGLSEMVSRASELADRPIHVYLAGHVHVLGAIAGRLPQPALTVIAGSGSHAEKQSSPEYRILDTEALATRVGFVRLESFERTESPRLRVTLIATPAVPVLAFLGESVVAQFDLDEAGGVRSAE